MYEVLYKSVGTLQYSKDWRLVLKVDQDLADYYRAMIPKCQPNQRPRWAAHVTVVRQEKETPVHKEHWWKYNNHKVEFTYSPVVHFDKIYYWINVWCTKLELIRNELGMKVYTPFTLPPSGFNKNFHCTIANSKD